MISEAKSPSSDASHENGNAPFSSQTSCDEPTECSEGSERNNSKDTVRDCNVRQQGKPGHFKASLTVSKGSKTSEEQTVTKVKSKPANSINKLKDKNTKEVKKRRGSEGDKKIPARKKPKVVSPVWVQCDSCDKWRLLRDCMDPSALPKKWTCSMNSGVFQLLLCVHNPPEDAVPVGLSLYLYNLATSNHCTLLYPYKIQS